MSSGVHLSSEALSASIQDYLRTSGYSQKQLAEAIGLNPKVLSRKLHGSGNAYLTHLEVKSIIMQLAAWHIIGGQDEVLQLLKMAQAGSNLFSEEEWQKPPLSTLTKKRVLSSLARGSSGVAMRQHNLPALATRLIGRDWAVARLQQLLGREEVRLVTLVGSGGSGKTRLALQVASEMMESFAQGVRFVPLARVHDPKQVPMTIIQALQISAALNLSPMQSVIAYLNNKQLLLVLDNLEQIGGATAILGELLAAVPGLKIMATSRMLLRLYGEHAFSVPPLDLPAPTIPLNTDSLSQYSAIQLFVERAQAVVPDFTITDENASTIAQICARVDGLPLAIELAAARIKVLPPPLLLERLTNARLQVLTGGAKDLPGRQQTLRNTIAWSYNLLTPLEQTWFRRLGIFNGSWSLEAAETMMQDATIDQSSTLLVDTPLDMLEQLVDNTLIVRLPSAGLQARFGMLETLREYALEWLNAFGESESLRDWHACYYLREVEAAEKGLRGPRQSAWLARLAADHDNFRAALQWSLKKARLGECIRTFSLAQQSARERQIVAGSRILSEHGLPDNAISAVELCLRLAAAFRPYLEWQGYLPEARNWLKEALALPMEPSAGEAVLAARAKALSEAARLVSLEHNQGHSAELAEESIALWRQLNDRPGLASALLHRSWSAHATGDYATAKRLCSEGLSCLSPAEDPWLYAQLLFYLGAEAGFNSDYEQMHALYTQSKERFKQLGDTSAVADVLKDHGGMLILKGSYTESIDYLLKSIRLSYELEHKQYLTTGFGLLSFAVGLRGEPDGEQASLLSAQLEGVYNALKDAIGFSSWLESFPVALMFRQQIRARVDERLYEAALAEGRKLTIEQAIALVDQ